MPERAALAVLPALAVTLAFALAPLWLLPVPARAEIPAGRQAELLHLLAHDCGSCHGLRLTGGLGPALTPQALADRSPDALRATIMNGRPGSGMPPWRPFLSEEEAGWLAETMRRGTDHASAPR